MSILVEIIGPERLAARLAAALNGSEGLRALPGDATGPQRDGPPHFLLFLRHGAQAPASDADEDKR